MSIGGWAEVGGLAVARDVAVGGVALARDANDRECPCHSFLLIIGKSCAVRHTGDLPRTGETLARTERYLHA